MYLVIEIQKTKDDNLTYLVTTHDTLSEAESKWHTVLSYAALSDVSIHSATILNESGALLMTQSYTHQQTEE